MEEKQLSQEELVELLQGEEVSESEEVSQIPFNEDIIYSMEEFTQPDTVEFDLGVKDSSRYIGQFSSLINAGLDSDTAIVIMSWIREEKLNNANNEAQIKMVKEQTIQITKERI